MYQFRFHLLFLLPLLLLMISNEGVRSERFIVVSVQRSGSTFLMDRLKEVGSMSHGVLSTVVREPMLERLAETNYSFPYAQCSWDGCYQHALESEFKNLGCPFTTDPRNVTTAKNCGFKLMYTEMPTSIAKIRHGHERSGRHSTLFEKWIGSNNISMIHLVRRSHVRRVLSELRMKATGIAHVRKPESYGPVAPLQTGSRRVADLVMESIRSVERVSASFASASPRIRVMTVDYEALVDDNLAQETFARILDFISPGLKERGKRLQPTALVRFPFLKCVNLTEHWSEIHANLRKFRHPRRFDVNALDYSIADCYHDNSSASTCIGQKCLKPCMHRGGCLDT